MNFKQWVIERYIDKDTPTGDLARDINRDNGFPDTDNFLDMKAYLRRKRACSEAIATLERAYKVYTRYKIRLMEVD